jgi:hypothetical protein
MRSGGNRRPERLGDILRSVMRGAGFPKRGRSAELRDAWSKVAGDAADRAAVAGYRAGVVEIEVRSAALHHELCSFRKQELLDALRAQVPGMGIRDLRFRQT